MGSCVVFLVNGVILQQRIPLLRNRVSAEKKDYLDCYTIVLVTVEETIKRIQKHEMDVWFNVNIASVIDFQLTYYLQYQFHKVFRSVLTKAGRGAPETPLHKNWSFLLRISSVNAIKSVGNCGFGHIYWGNP